MSKKELKDRISQLEKRLFYNDSEQSIFTFQMEFTKDCDTYNYAKYQINDLIKEENRIKKKILKLKFILLLVTLKDFILLRK